MNPEKLPQPNSQEKTAKEVALAQEVNRAFNRGDLDTAEKKIKELKNLVSSEVEHLEIKEAEAIFGKDFLGPKAAENLLGLKLEAKDIPPMSFSIEELKRAKELDQQLTLQVDKTKDGEPLTIRKLNEVLKGKASDGRKFLFGSKGSEINTERWFNKEIFVDQPIISGWRLASKEIIPNSTNKNYFEQTEVLIDYLKNKVFKGMEMPKEYENAIQDFEDQKDQIRSHLNIEERTIASQLLESLQITRLTRESPVEIIYRLAMQEKNNKDRLLKETYSWTRSRSAFGQLVLIGDSSTTSLDVTNGFPLGKSEKIGVCFSRMK